MSDATIVLRPAGENTLPTVGSLLAANGLPTRDVEEKPGCFYLGYAEDKLVGVGGVETYAAEGLLRSIVVEESVRGNGFGAAICERLEGKARAQGVETLYLLILTDENPCGFSPASIERVLPRCPGHSSPDCVRFFAALCPGLVSDLVFTYFCPSVSRRPRPSSSLAGDTSRPIARQSPK